MKRINLTLVPMVGLLLWALAHPVCAADKGEGGKKERTITGTGLCAKCALHETSSCRNAIQVERKGKKVTYYLVQNEVSKDFHDNICKGPQQVKATGLVKKNGDKLELTASKIELVK